jgi:hypothetical protein
MSPQTDRRGHATDGKASAASCLAADMALSAVLVLLGDARAWHDP